MKQKTKRYTFELEVVESFNPYSFFTLFKRIQNKGFFRDVLTICKLDQKGKAVEMKLDEKDLLERERFIFEQQYKIN